MPVKHITIYGTKDEVKTALAIVATSINDKILERPHTLYEHMNKQLGFTAYQTCISKKSLSAKTIDALRLYALDHPKMLFKIDTASGVVITLNYQEDDKDYPGPFGALCKRYGVLFRKESE